jgi:hypothetical protein
MRQKKLIKAVICLLLIFFITECQTVKRGRNEGTMNIPASNVTGNGNLDVMLESATGYSRNDGFVFAPAIGAQIGFSNMMQLSGRFVPITKTGLGPIEAHLQITTPDNDNLRLLGVALRADIFLSNTQDTLSATTQNDKPEYNPYLLPSLIIDADWLAVFPSIPVKTYICAGMADNVELLSRYNELYLKAAFEWKTCQHSLYVAGGGGFYQEKQTKTTPEDKSYKQNYFWVEPGARYRLWNRISLLGAIKLAIFKHVKENDPLEPELFNFSIRMEVPILYKETNTEAIRTLIFMKTIKGKQPDSLDKKISAGKTLLKDVNASLLGLQDSTEKSDALEEKEEIKKRREDTQKKMDEIEKLFMKLNEEDNIRTDSIPAGEKK